LKRKGSLAFGIFLFSYFFFLFLGHFCSVKGAFLALKFENFVRKKNKKDFSEG
jgi:hypothetical protein